jgi:hypothetical protein
VTSNNESVDSFTEESKALDVDGVAAAIAGTVAFALAFVVLFFFRSTLAAHDTEWWVWVCAAGAVMGLIGVAYTTRRRAAYRAAGRTNR